MTSVEKKMKEYGNQNRLREELSGFWSRRINENDRLIYKVDGNNILILACRYEKYRRMPEDIRKTIVTEVFYLFGLGDPLYIGFSAPK